MLTICALFNVGWGSAREEWPFSGKHGSPSGQGGGAGIGNQEGVSGKAPESPPSSGQAEMLPRGPWRGAGGGIGPVGGQDAGAEAGRPPLDPTSPLLPGITVYCCPSGTSRAPGGPERLAGQGMGPAPETRWLLAQPLSSDPIGSPQATWKTLEGGRWTVPVPAPPLSTGPPTSPGCWRRGLGGGGVCMVQRPLYMMNHSSTLGKGGTWPWGFLERKSTRLILTCHSPRRPQL